MQQLSYNRSNVITEMNERATQDLANVPVSVNVTTGATTGYLIGDLFDFDVTNIGNRQVQVNITDVEEARQLIAAARPDAPTNHRRSFTTFLKEMDAAVEVNATRRLRNAADNYHYLLTGSTSSAPTEGQAGYIQRSEYTLRALGLDDLVATHNRIEEMKRRGFLWRASNRYGREIIALSSDLYDEEAGYTAKSFGFSVLVTTELTVGKDGVPFTTYRMELTVDHSSWANNLVQSYVLAQGITREFSTTGTFEEATEMATSTLMRVIEKAEYITAYAIEQRVTELDRLGFNHEMRLITTEAIAS